MGNNIYEQYFQERLVPDARAMKCPISYILKNKNGSVADFIANANKSVYDEFLENGIISQLYELDKTNRYMQLSWIVNHDVAKHIYIRLYGWFNYVKLMYLLPKHKIS